MAKGFLLLLTYSDGEQRHKVFDAPEKAEAYLKKVSDEVPAGDPYVCDYSILKVKVVSEA